MSLADKHFEQVTARRANDRLAGQTQALHLYERTCNQDWLARTWLALTGRPCCLLDLSTLPAPESGRAYRYVGRQRVPLQQIRGSSSPGRCHDFDAGFHPLNPHNQSRWLGVAEVWQRGQKLPPVSLIQLGDIYFVQDGHHRVSVAKAQGEQSIEAEVTVWQVAGPLRGEG